MLSLQSHGYDHENSDNNDNDNIDNDKNDSENDVSFSVMRLMLPPKTQRIQFVHKPYGFRPVLTIMRGELRRVTVPLDWY